MTSGVLDDVRVLEIGQGISSCFCGKLFADLGAEVIKVEPPDAGDELRAHGPFPGDVPHPERSGLFLYLNTSKLGVTLDLASPTGRGILRQLLGSADVLVENYAPGALASWGLDVPALLDAFPRLVITSVTPYGQSGPWRDYRGYDINVAAVSGVAAGIGSPDREPLALPLAQTEYQGAIAGAVATLFALFARDMTGRGQHVDVSSADVLATLHVAHSKLPPVLYRDARHARTGHRDPEMPYPQTTLQCKDGYMCLGAPQIQQWARFTQAMGNPDWVQNPRYRKRRAMAQEYPDEVDALLAPWLMARTKEEIFTLCREHHVPFAPIRTMDEVASDPHLAERGFFVAAEHPAAGPLTYPGAPYKLSAAGWAIRRPAPLHGEHNEEVYCNRLGYSRGDLCALRRAGVV